MVLIRSVLAPAVSEVPGSRRRWNHRATLPILVLVAFRDVLHATIRAARPVLESPGVVVVGSEVPNLLEPGAASTLVVSQDLDIGVPVDAVAALRERLGALVEFRPSAEEPSVWTPLSEGLLELNFIGMDPTQDPSEAYVLESEDLPLLVFGSLSFISPGAVLEIEGTRLALPRPAGLLLEKLITDRTGEKGDRDLLVALGVVATATAEDLVEFEESFSKLRPDLRHAILSNLTILSLLSPRFGMPDPEPRRAQIASLIERLSSAP